MILSTSYVSSLLSHNNLLYVGGHFQKNGGLTADGIGAWNGLQWSGFKSGVSLNGVVYAIKFYNNNLYIGGNFNKPSTGAAVDNVPGTNGIARWDGSKWNSVGGGLPFGDNIEEMEVYQGKLYVVGNFVGIGSITNIHCCIAAWDSVQWDTLQGGSLNNVGQAIIYKDDLYVGGNFSILTDTPSYYMGRYDGMQWHPVGQGLSYFVNVFAVDAVNDVLYAGGDFFNSYNYDGSVVNTKFVAMWDGQKWHSLGVVPLETNCTSLKIYHGKLYAAGWAATGSTSDTNIAAWDGVSWQPITGLDNGIGALEVHQDTLYVGGFFKIVNYTDSAFYLAKWWTPNYCDSTHLASWAANNTSALLSDSFIFQFTAAGYANQWEWDFGDGLTDTAQNPQHIYHSAGEYWLRLRTTFGLCPWENDSMRIAILNSCNDLSAAIFTVSDTFFLSNGQATVLFTDSSAYATSWLWDFGDGLTDTAQNPQHIYNSAGVYNAMLIAGSAGCSDTAYKSIIVQDTATGIEKLHEANSTLKIYPNPTGSGFVVEVGTEELKGKNTELNIVSLDGKVVYKADIAHKRKVIDTAGWEKGIYIVNLVLGGKVVGSKRMILK